MTTDHDELTSSKELRADLGTLRVIEAAWLAGLAALVGCSLYFAAHAHLQLGTMQALLAQID